jgi:hypothetical protein
MIAPQRLEFFDRNWTRVGSKDEYEFKMIFSGVTKVPIDVLDTGSLSNTSL